MFVAEINLGFLQRCVEVEEEEDRRRFELTFVPQTETSRQDLKASLWMERVLVTDLTSNFETYLEIVERCVGVYVKRWEELKERFVLEHTSYPSETYKQADSQVD